MVCFAKHLVLSDLFGSFNARGGCDALILSLHGGRRDINGDLFCRVSCDGLGPRCACMLYGQEANLGGLANFTNENDLPSFVKLGSLALAA